jgi:hypothetical protein
LPQELFVLHQGHLEQSDKEEYANNNNNNDKKTSSTLPMGSSLDLHYLVGHHLFLPKQEHLIGLSIYEK